MYNSHSNSIRSMTPALLLAVAIAVPASADYPNLATVAATDSVATLANPGYLAAAGSFLGNINGSAWELTALGEVFGAYSQEPWVYQGKSDDLDFGPFTGNPETTQGILTFATPQTGLFVLGLKGGNSYSWYLFNGGADGIESLNFDTLGIQKGNRNPGPELSHANLYTAHIAVPEPEQCAVIFGGLAAAGFILRRRRQ